MDDRLNILYFQVDNLGFGELSCYSGGPLRGAWTQRIDAFAGQGFRMTNFAPEAQCTPSRSALLTGRYAIRSGNPQRTDGRGWGLGTGPVGADDR
jgi:arylsulfatase